MERHDLLHEFPELTDKIHELKTQDAHFKKLFDSYHELEHQIHRINTEEEVVIDEYAHELKAKLLHLKDEIYTRLQE
ncbi:MULTISPECIES: YdcH family protein [Flavobacterium]|uniref:DUF465 domain-containing protein n=1 Tax=Flavobacterium stagni TaxID=2506421 RepID=A0A4Q1KDM1_9FLAO|nr:MULTISPECIES: DUF465 domain-containing protein [Flavobacterium]RXR23492.1 DUF465 domain-containing protein [Flavobacterium stagni]